MRSNLLRLMMFALLLIVSSGVSGIESAPSSTNTDRRWTDAEVQALVNDLTAACETAIDESVLAALNEANTRIKQAQDEKKAAQDSFAVGCFVSAIVGIVGTSLVWNFCVKWLYSPLQS